MTAVLSDLGRWFWRLAPANPILVRVVHAGSRRQRHLLIRALYLAVLAGIVGVGVVTTQTGTATSLADLAKGATQVFKWVAIVQLAMVCFLAPIFAAAAITQERDSQTYNILLATPLSNAQIVFGSLLSRMYFVLVLLLAGLPLFCVMMVYGGVTLREILLAMGLAEASALASGSLAIAISVIRVGTRRTIFSFYFFIAAYLIGLWSLASAGVLAVAEASPAPGQSDRMSWLAVFHPLLALQAALNVTPAPPYSAVAPYGFPWSWLAAYPAQSFVVIMNAAAGLMCLASVFFVRAVIKEGEPVWYSRLLSRGGERTTAESERGRRPRHVWNNAVAWREAMTSAGRGGRMAQRVVVIVIGLLAALAVIWYYAKGVPTPTIRLWLQAVIAIEMGLSLLVAANTSATSLTREKEGGTLEILLVTPLVSRDILRGKIRGLISYAVPMVGVPFLSLLLFVLYDLAKGRYGGAGGAAAGAGGPVVYPEVLLTLPLMMLSFAAFACAVGMQASLKARRTVQAVVQSVGALLLVCGVTATCFAGIAGQEWRLGALLLPLSPIGAAFVTINPEQWLGFAAAGPNLGDIQQSRILSAMGASVSIGVYLSIAYGMYKSMVRNFDMIIRRQMT